MVDYYKFFAIMIVIFVCLMVLLLMVVCSCYIISYFLPRATYTDSRGNLYDQYDSKMGLKLRKKTSLYEKWKIL